MVFRKTAMAMRLVLVLTVLLAGCSGQPGFYQYNHEQRFQCDMDPNRQMCASPQDIRRHVDQKK